MNDMLDGLDTDTLLAVLGLLCMGIGVAWVLSPGWALIVMAVLVLGYVVLPDRKVAE